MTACPINSALTGLHYRFDGTWGGGVLPLPPQPDGGIWYYFARTPGDSPCDDSWITYSAHQSNGTTQAATAAPAGSDIYSFTTSLLNGNVETPYLPPPPAGLQASETPKADTDSGAGADGQALVVTPDPEPEATYLRHFSRHLHATIQDLVEAHLVTCGWLTDGASGFETLLGALPVEYQRQRPEESMLKSLKPNLVTVSFGGQSDDEPEEMGDGLFSQEHTIFADIYAENDAVAVALAEDIRDLFAGRSSTSGRFFRVINQVTTTPILGVRAEFTEVFREPADRELPSVRWQIVRAAAQVEMSIP